MKKISPWLGMLLMSLSSALAQVAVEVVQDQDQFLSGETLTVGVKITNRSGQTLQLGSDPDWLTFSVESVSGEIISKTGDVPVVGEFSLDTSKVATKRVDLAPYFSLARPGHYSIVATVSLKNWDQRISSRPKSFDVIEGARLWEQEFGVPGSAGSSNGVPEVRKYILQEANHLRGRLKLYFRLTDATGVRISRTTAIGPMVSFSRPEAQVDKESNLHVLFADGARTFSYTSFNPDGDLILRQTYEYVKTRPRLQPDADGKISVVGGVRRPNATDLPPAKPASNDEVTKP